MMDDGLVLCAANAYIQKYYFNEEFRILPQSVREELQILCVSFTEEVGGIFTLYFHEDGTLCMRTEASESDALYDEIGAGLRIQKIRRDKEELFRSLELFYQTFC